MKVLNAGQRDAVSQLKHGGSFCVYGAAGTGKSVVRDRIAAMVPSVVLGPTGMSMAGCSGMTVARFLRAKPKTILAPGALAKSMSHVPDVPGFTIIVDEAPMVTPAHFVALDHGCQKLRRCSKPFGGIRVVILGDYCQLAPPSDEQPIFTTPSFKRLKPRVLVLTEQMRQRDEPDLTRLLEDCRACHLTEESAQTLLRLNLVTPYLDAVRLCATVAEARQYNEARLKRAPGQPTKVNHATKVKPGCPVCVNRNIYRHGRLLLANGVRGTVTAVTANQCTIKCGAATHVLRHPAPIDLAYAMTIHRAQGQTYTAVTVVGTRIFAPGQLYTALSRVTTLSGLACVDVLPTMAEIPYPDSILNHLSSR